jgi:hypothetical protein
MRWYLTSSRSGFARSCGHGHSKILVLNYTLVVDLDRAAIDSIC